MNATTIQRIMMGECHNPNFQLVLSNVDSGIGWRVPSVWCRGRLMITGLGIIKLGSISIRISILVADLSCSSEVVAGDYLIVISDLYELWMFVESRVHSVPLFVGIDTLTAMNDSSLTAGVQSPSYATCNTKNPRGKLPPALTKRAKK